ncbi:MAG: DUF21 domain-containing protein [Proteobacteria bacterium]|nr:DUF21 domain-containing protein [Pseudomonadota bacterium]
MIDLIFIIAFLICLSAFTSSLEAAFFSLSTLEIKDIERKNKRRAELIKKMMKSSELFLISILFYNNFINVSIGYYTSRLARIIKVIPKYENWVLITVTFIMTLLVIVFAEYIPKLYAIKFNKRLSINASALAYFMFILFYPFAFLISKVLGLSGKTTKQNEYTVSEYKTIIELNKSKGIINYKEARFLKNFLTFSNLSVGEVMTPRAKIAYFTPDMIYDDVIDIIKSKYCSRYPVINHSSVIGIFYVKTLTAYDSTKEFHLEDYIIKPIFATKTSSAYKLLNKFEKQHMHMAIVLGEYGEIAGLVTMEDILEEVVGDIKDEFDIFDDDEIKKSRSKYFEISGSVELDRLSDILNADLTKEGIDTLNGLLILDLGRLPKKGDKIRYKGFEFTVNSVEERVADKVHVRKI